MIWIYIHDLPAESNSIARNGQREFEEILTIAIEDWLQRKIMPASAAKVTTTKQHRKL